MKKSKIILFDLETSPNTGYTWARYEQNVIEFKKEWELLSFAWKELGSKKVKCLGRDDFKDKTDKSLVKALWNVMNEADVLIGHNSDSFDIKKAKAKFIEHGLPPYSPIKSVDTRKIARRYFKFNSNALDDLGKFLKVGRKVKHEGFSLWLKCMAGDKKAFKSMKKYNKQDVALLERVYLKLRGWMDQHPTIHVDDRLDSCPKCGSHKLQAQGLRRTSRGLFQRYQCQSCGGWAQSIKKEKNSPNHKVKNG